MQKRAAPLTAKLLTKGMLATYARPALNSFFGLMVTLLPQRSLKRLLRQSEIVAALAACSLLFSTLSYGQSWSGILSSARAVNWSNAGIPATLPDGETTPNPWTPPVRRACTSAQAGIAVPVSSSTSVSSLNTAIAACAAANPNGSYLLLGSGTFTINSTINLYGVNNISLRGSGPMSTTLNLTPGNNIAMGWYLSGGAGTLQADYSAGTTSITVGSISGIAPVVGSVASVTQCDTGSGAQPCSTSPSDNGSLFICGDYNPCQSGSNSTTVYSHQQQNVLITNAVNNSNGTYTLTISPGLYMPNWTTGNGAMIQWNSSSHQDTGVGLEDFTIYSPTNPTNFLIQAANTYASWIKGLRILGAGASFPVKIQNSKNFLVFNNYCASGISLSLYSQCYSIDATADSLLLNNISAQGLPMEYNGKNTGLVTAYNFARDGFTPYTENVLSFDHSAFSSFNLYEGNESGNMTEDDIWGTHALNTYFRNYILGFDSPYIGGGINARGLNLANYQRFENAIGNVIGSSQVIGYQGTGNGYAFEIFTGDPLVASTLMRWGNVTNITQSTDTPANSGVRFVSSEVPSALSSPNTAWQNPVPSTHNLPCSFYFSIGSSPCKPLYSGGTGLSWWKVCTMWTTFPTSCAATKTQPFPVAGPELSGGPYVNGYADDIPAAIAWRNLPIDATYQNSYTITGSSWSGGIETLTISGLPSYNCGGSAPCNLLGAFQLSGANSACTAGATAGPGNELFMTNSSPTTVSYALASNPGIICTGTMKFPDVRQFDERVYQTDSGAPEPAPVAPTALTTSVQ